MDLFGNGLIIKNYKHLKEFDSFRDTIKEYLNEEELRERKSYSIIYFLMGGLLIFLIYLNY